jgi:hypothetical protein
VSRNHLNSQGNLHYATEDHEVMCWYQDEAKMIWREETQGASTLQ